MMMMLIKTIFCAFIATIVLPSVAQAIQTSQLAPEFAATSNATNRPATTTTTTATKPQLLTVSTPTVALRGNHGRTETILKKSTITGIGDIRANVTLFEGKVLQLQVSWKDVLPNDTSYNILVSPVNLTACPDLPCSVYGIAKPSDYLTLPDSPMSYVDEMECNYMFDCNYTLTVETSNAALAHTAAVAIPYCVMGVCSCQHAHMLPKVRTVAGIRGNDTIDFNWSIRVGNAMKHNETDAVAAVKLASIYLRISEQTNPSLSWGGKLIPIAETLYAIKNISSRRVGSDELQGSIEINVKQLLTAKAVLNLHSYLIDEYHCAGPPSLMKLQVPGFGEPETELAENDFDLRVALIVVSTIFVFVILGGVASTLWCRRREKTNDELAMNEQYLSPFATIVEMEDNINYVDKDVEDAQARGLADAFEVAHHAILLVGEIGEGAFGRVYKATALNLRRMRGITIVAVKQLKKDPTADEVSEFLDEIEMLKGVGTHNNIVCFLGCCSIRPPYMMIMEYVGRGDLLSYLRTVRQEMEKLKPKDANYVERRSTGGGVATAPSTPVKYIELKISTQSVDSEAEMAPRQPKASFAETTYTTIDDEEFKEPFEYKLDNKELHNFALQIANGMRFLEEQEITHRDLAARNVLIDDQKTLKISDFGLSRHGIYTNTKTRKLPLRWLSIEAIRDNVYSSRSDIWAYAVVLWEIGTLGASPYPTVSNHELLPFLKAGNRLEKPEICTNQVYALMLQCWSDDPDERPTFDELYTALRPKTVYVDINSLSDDYVFPPIQDKVANA